MSTNLKTPLALVAVLTMLSMASCQSESVEPQTESGKKTTFKIPALQGDEDQPPKDGNGGGGR